MLREFFLFDLRFQLSSPLPWATALLFSVLAFFADFTVAFDGTLGNANLNAPVAILERMAILSMLSMFFITLFIAQPLLRDHETGIAELFFSKPVKKSDYLLGRFAAGFALCLMLFALMLAMMVLGSAMPWVDARQVGPFRLMSYVFALLIVVLPNLLFIAGGMALLASATRSILAVYVGIIAFIGMWGVSTRMMVQLDSQTAAILLDPIGYSALVAMTRYWVVLDFNTRLPEFSGLFLANRLLWGALGLAMLGVAVKVFKTTRAGTAKAWFGRRVKSVNAATAATPATPAQSGAAAPARRRFTPATGGMVALRQFLHLTWFDTIGIVKSSAFLAFALIAVLLYWINLEGGIVVYGGAQYPVTSWALTIAMRSMGLMLSIIVVFYAGDLIDKERAAKMHEVTAACPTHNLLPLLSKAAALVAVALAFLLITAETGVLYQSSRGYANHEAGLYARGLLLAALPYILLSFLALSVQVFAQNKFVGYLIIVVFVALDMAAGPLGLESNLLLFGKAPPLVYSDMDGYGNNLRPHLTFMAYWFLFGVMLLILAASAWMRGPLPSFKHRLGLAAKALRGPLGVALALTGAGFFSLGGWIYYNTHVLNNYLPESARLDLSEAYEREYKRFENLPQPKISAVDVALDMSPKAGTLAYKVVYKVNNPHRAAISELHLLVNRKLRLSTQTLAFAELVKLDSRFGLYVLRLKTPLAAGAGATWEFDLAQAVSGFGNRGDNSMLLKNGSFLHSTRLLPSFGYNRDGQILAPQERARRALAPLPAMARLEDAAALNVAFNASNGLDASDDADWVDMNTVVSTDPDQVALAPGVLQKEWLANGRRYFHYKVDGKTPFYAAWLSGRWNVKRDQWEGLPIEVYSDPKHPYNVDRMIAASKASLDYFSAAFSPYQHKQLRIIEFPRTMGFFAEGFGGTVPFAESLGFIKDLRDPDKVDMVFYVTAHEVAHQWWGHQVLPANVQGATMVAESLAQYSALMVMERTYGKAKMRQFLKRELDEYLQGRGSDKLAEQPLYRVENQAHIHYAKGALAFYRLADEIGADAVNRALKKFVAATAFQGPPFTTSAQLLQFIRAEAGPEYQQLITDLFEKITLYDNRVREATSSKRKDGRFDVSFTVSAAKFYADGQGAETAAPMDDWVELAVFARAGEGREQDEKVLLSERKRIGAGSQTFTYVVDEKPFEVGIDPYNKLIDRVSGDNRMLLVVR